MHGVAPKGLRAPPARGKSKGNGNGDWDVVVAKMVWFRGAGDGVRRGRGGAVPGRLYGGFDTYIHDGMLDGELFLRF